MAGKDNSMIIRFRQLSADDLEWARLLHNDPEVLGMVTDPHIVTQEEQLAWFDRLSKSPSSRRLVSIINEERVGIVRLDNIDIYNRSVCIGMDIHKDHRGKGFAKPLYKDLVSKLFKQEYHHRIWLLVADYNERAKHIYLQLGFKEEGRARDALYRNGSYHDYLMMSILSHEWLEKNI